jgi:hypothetical protein
LYIDRGSQNGLDKTTAHLRFVSIDGIWLIDAMLPA